MKKQKTMKELKRNNNILFWMLMAFVLLTLVFSIFDLIGKRKLEQQLQERIPITCEYLPKMISDSCVIGCIYSTKFYYNNSEVNLEDASYECMMNCLGMSYEISGKICGVIE